MYSLSSYSFDHKLHEQTKTVTGKSCNCIVDYVIVIKIVTLAKLYMTNVAISFHMQIHRAFIKTLLKFCVIMYKMLAGLRLDDTSVLGAWQTPSERAVTVGNNPMNINNTSTHPQWAETTKHGKSYSTAICSADEKNKTKNLQ